MQYFSTPDIVAISFYALAWAAYAIAMESHYGAGSLNSRMNGYREIWNVVE